MFFLTPVLPVSSVTRWGLGLGGRVGLLFLKFTTNLYFYTYVGGSSHRQNPLSGAI